MAYNDGEHKRGAGRLNKRSPRAGNGGLFPPIHPAAESPKLTEESNMKKTMALLLFIILTIASLGAAWAEQPGAAEEYEKGLYNLQLELSTALNMPEDKALELLTGYFQRASGYGQADGFLLYVRVLDGIRQKDFDQAEKDLALLKEDKGLNALLADEAFALSYPAVKPVETLEKYLTARRAEAAGDIDAAMAAYRECGDFYNSSACLEALERQREEETVTYAKGYVRVLSPTQSGWLPLPEEEPYIFPLRQMREDGTITVNNICVTPNGVYMESSTCENQDCVHQGMVTLDNMDQRILENMIICLPNQVYLELYSTEQLLGAASD